MIVEKAMPASFILLMPDKHQLSSTKNKKACHSEAKNFTMAQPLIYLYY